MFFPHAKHGQRGEHHHRARIYRDADTSHYLGPTRFGIVIEQRDVTARDVLSLNMAPGGGYAIRLKAQ
ncbi:MAG: hypothetical protein HKO13_02180 [Sphingomonas sp.]|nr:hypothetical protein [Sphingomonas sp.]